MAVLWSATIFLSAFLLFLIQPMMGKMILPMLGGTPAVWNTCMLFYQATLLSGYAYVHLMTSAIDPKRQMLIHLGLLLVPVLMLPILGAVMAGALGLGAFAVYAAGSPESVLVGASSLERRHRTTVFSLIHDRSVAAKVVLLERSSSRGGSLFPVRGQ